MSHTTVVKQRFVLLYVLLVSKIISRTVYFGLCFRLKANYNNMFNLE